MKLDRLIGILAVLLQKDQVTAPELAELFEVSRRTINRDIEALCMAGGIRRGNLHYGGLPDGQDDSQQVGYAGHSGRTEKSGQCQRHKPVHPAYGKAVPGSVRPSGRGPSYPD